MHEFHGYITGIGVIIIWYDCLIANEPTMMNMGKSIEFYIHEQFM